ncbi:DUF4129 domain-containing protein [Agromyces cerinus]|uniref:Protein-glutamine gamma-glutamyltransferase-like C-terminal domain-containing protein n=1 Tax=Agromyces cerinus subsp. cerinus TaxID=232089 RepID=A0A1N6DJ15_9MICO|nr:DUF4129 domain-containing protein [Agromyces cerinus]SIN70748.1 protein of unknown function [Agromyces cerinus subsp. cerinus]
MAVIRLRGTPLDPDAPEARRWLEDELTGPEYQAAKPSPFDVAMQAIRDWFVGLFDGATGLPGPLLTLLLVLLITAVVVVGLLVFGVPRLRRRRRSEVPLFDDHDLRDLDTLRRAATAAASAGDWPLAIEERFRALVRGLVEREVVTVHPGTTARTFADAAAVSFPDLAAELRDAAGGFDGVRYLGRAGSPDEYARVTDLERRVADARPAGRGDHEASAYDRHAVEAAR